MHRSNESLLFAPLPEHSRLIRWLKRVTPNPKLSFRSQSSRQQFALFLQRMTDHSGATILNVGSKSVDLGLDVLNLDIHPYPGIHIVGDGHCLPVKEQSVSGVIITSVLEHVADPTRVVREIERVLQINGEVYVEVPFMYHFHPDPEDYQRYSLTGLEQLFRNFNIVDKGMCVGPSSALASMLSQYIPILLCFNSRYLYKVLVRLCLFVVAPLTLLDVFLEKVPYSRALAGSYFLVGLKKVDVA